MYQIVTLNIIFNPLYIKAVDIAVRVGVDIVLRYGGFNLLMSFVGFIGHLMEGSGLKEMLGLVFGSNTVDMGCLAKHMLALHKYIFLSMLH